MRSPDRQRSGFLHKYSKRRRFAIASSFSVIVSGRYRGGLCVSNSLQTYARTVASKIVLGYREGNRNHSPIWKSLMLVQISDKNRVVGTHCDCRCGG
jgi:hypothetical protein